MSKNKYIQQLLTKGIALPLLLCAATMLHAQQHPAPDMTKFTKGPIAQGNGNGFAARTTTAPARVSVTLPSDQAAQASDAGNGKSIKSVNRSVAAAPSTPGTEQMNMQPAAERVKPKQEPVKVPTQQN